MVYPVSLIIQLFCYHCFIYYKTNNIDTHECKYISWKDLKRALSKITAYCGFQAGETMYDVQNRTENILLYF